MNTLKNDSRIVSVLSPTIASSRLLPLIGFPLWLPPFQRGSSILSPSLALVTAAHQFSPLGDSSVLPAIHNVK